MLFGAYFSKFRSRVVLVSLAAILATNMFSAFGAQQSDGIRITDKNGLTAVDDGDTALCTASLSPVPTVVYHLAISDPKLMRFASTGACLYVTDQVGAIRGDILVVSGSGGTTAVKALTDATGYTSEYTADGFRVTDIAFDAPWEDTDPTDKLPGSFLNASNKLAAAANWAYAVVHLDANGHPAGTTLAFCGQGPSGGSSLMDYQISHDGEDAKFDHITMIAASPFTRIDVGCNASSPAISAPTWCAWTPNPDSPVYSPHDASNISTWSHEPNCGTHNPSALPVWEAQSVVSPGEKLSYSGTSISVIVCQNDANQTQALANYRFGDNGQRITLMLSKDPGFGKYPHYYCDADGSRETISTAGHDWVVSEMNTSCFPKH